MGELTRLQQNGASLLDGLELGVFQYSACKNNRVLSGNCLFQMGLSPDLELPSGLTRSAV